MGAGRWPCLNTYQHRKEETRYPRRVDMAENEKDIRAAAEKHNAFLKELGLPLI